MEGSDTYKLKRKNFSMAVYVSKQFDQYLGQEECELVSSMEANMSQGVGDLQIPAGASRGRSHKVCRSCLWKNKTGPRPVLSWCFFLG